MEEEIFDFIIKFYNKYDLHVDEFVKNWGKKIYTLNTSHGMPIENIIDMLCEKYERDMITMMYIYYTGFLTSHNIVSEMSKSNLKIHQENNIKKTYNMIKTGRVD